MRVLLAQSTLYVPTFAGENKVNRVLMEGLATHGHACHVLAPTCGKQGPQTPAQFRRELELRGIVATVSGRGESYVFHQNGVAVHAVVEPSNFCPYLARRIREFQPTHVITSAGDPGLVLLEAVLTAASCPVVYLAHTPLYFPFGPVSLIVTPARQALFHRLAGIVAVSQYCCDYIRKWAGLEATVIYAPVYGRGPFRQYGDFGSGFITMINPCAYKGISIFLALARAMPEISFAAVPTWGTTRSDRAALEAVPNVRILEARDNVDDIYSQTRVLLVPSLWDEGFGVVCVEAMLRGIPVLASDTGGLPEAKLGVDHLLPVHPITQCRHASDSQGLRMPVVPKQDIDPWLRALRELLTDRDRYERLSAVSRDTACAFASSLGIEPFEKFLNEATSQGRARPSMVAQDSVGERFLHRVEGLTHQKQQLLLTRLRQKPDEPTHAKSG